MRLHFVAFVILICSFAGPLRAQWARTNGLADTAIECLAVNGTNLFAGTPSGVYRSADNGDTWLLLDSGLIQKQILSIVTMQSDLFISAWDNKGYSRIYRSTNEGESWLPLSDTFPSRYITPGIRHLFVRDTDLFAGAACGGVFLSTNRGMTWQAVDTGIMNPPDFQVSAIGGSQTNVFVKTDVGECSFAAPVKVFHSTSNGAEWKLASDSVQQMDLWDNETFVFTSLGLSSFAGGRKIVYQWSGINSQWSPVGVIPGNGPIQTFATSGKNIFATSNDAPSNYLFVSSDSAKTWKSVSTGLENVIQFSNASPIAANDQYLFMGIIEKGVWRRPLSEMIPPSAVAEKIATNDKVSAYPNPFSQTTTLSFTNGSRGYAYISIVNQLGLEVARIFSGELAAGEHSWIWDNSSRLPNAAYECIVRMNGQVERLPIVISR